MKQRGFEIFIAVVLTVISYFGDYYLKENLKTGVANYTLTWYVLDILWLLAMAAIGYWGLLKHEYKWVKTLWIIVNSVLLILLLINKLTQYFWHHSFIPDAASTVIRTPFLFIMAVFLPGWFNVYKPSAEK